MNFCQYCIARLKRLNYWQFAVTMVVAAVLLSVGIVFVIDILWDGKISAELELAGVVTPVIVGWILVQLIISILTELKSEVTRRERTEELLNESQQIARIGNWSRDLDTGIFTWPESALRIFEIDPAEFDGTYLPLLQRVHPDDREAVGALYRSSTETGETYETTYRLLLPDGRTKHVFARGTTLTNAKGSAGTMIGIVQDVTDRVTLEEELRRHATIDFLTGIPNRRHFNTLFQHELERSQRYGEPLSLIMFDIDQFKWINDTHGHEMGDRILGNVARVARKALRTSDVTARWGGEEFMVLAPHTSLDEAICLAERLREAVAKSRYQGVAVTVSMGVISCQSASSMDRLLREVDDLLYRAKSFGRNRIEAHRSDAPHLPIGQMGMVRGHGQ